MDSSGVDRPLFSCAVHLVVAHCSNWTALDWLNNELDDCHDMREGLCLIDVM